MAAAVSDRQMPPGKPYAYSRTRHALLALDRRWAHSVRCLPARVQATRRSARRCASSAAMKAARREALTYGRSSGFCVDPIEKKPLNHSTCRARVDPVVRHRRMQSGLQVLPELGHQQVARDGHARRISATPETIATRRCSSRLQERRVHLQRPGRSSPSTRWTSRTRAASAASRASP